MTDKKRWCSMQQEKDREKGKLITTNLEFLTRDKNEEESPKKNSKKGD